MKKIIINFLTIFLLINSFNISSQELAPSEVYITTPQYKAAQDFRPPLGEYTYTATWSSIPAAIIKINVDKIGDNYKINTSAKTTSGIDIFYKLRFSGDSEIDSNKMSPIKTTIDNKENRNRKITEISFNSDGSITSKRSKNGKQIEDLNFNTHNPTLDPFSAAFLARSLDWSTTTSGKFDVFTGKSRYQINFNLIGKDSIKIAGEQRKVWKLEPVIKNITKPNSESKLKQAFIYLSADEKREILKISSDVYIGSVVTELKSFKPKNDPFDLARN